MKANNMQATLDVEKILNIADGRANVVTFESQIRGMAQIIDGYEAAIITRKNGYLRIRRQDIPMLIEELQNLYEEIERRRRD